MADKLEFIGAQQKSLAEIFRQNYNCRDIKIDYVTIVFTGTSSSFVSQDFVELANLVAQQIQQEADWGLKYYSSIGGLHKQYLSQLRVAKHGTIRFCDHSIEKAERKLGPNTIRLSKQSFWWFAYNWGSRFSHLLAAGQVKVSRVDLYQEIVWYTNTLYGPLGGGSQKVWHIDNTQYIFKRTGQGILFRAYKKHMEKKLMRLELEIKYRAQDGVFILWLMLHNRLDCVVSHTYAQLECMKIGEHLKSLWRRPDINWSVVRLNDAEGTIVCSKAFQAQYNIASKRARYQCTKDITRGVKWEAQYVCLLVDILRNNIRADGITINLADFLQFLYIDSPTKQTKYRLKQSVLECLGENVASEPTKGLVNLEFVNLKKPRYVKCSTEPLFLKKARTTQPAVLPNIRFLFSLLNIPIKAGETRRLVFRVCVRLFESAGLGHRRCSVGLISAKVFGPTEGLNAILCCQRLVNVLELLNAYSLEKFGFFFVRLSLGNKKVCGLDHEAGWVKETRNGAYLANKLQAAYKAQGYTVVAEQKLLNQLQLGQWLVKK